MQRARLGKKETRVAACFDYRWCDLPELGGNTKGFMGTLPLARAGVKATAVKDEDGKICDYRDVEFEGYASTWNNLDRDGETFLKGAFAESIPAFMQNPVMLINHRNLVECLVGSYKTVREDKKGLFVHGVMSNGPGAANARFLVAEGHLQTLSVAGLFYFDETRSQIFKATLWEITLIPIPSNPQAIVQALKASPFYAEQKSQTRTRHEAGSRGEAPTAPRSQGLQIGGLTIV